MISDPIGHSHGRDVSVDVAAVQAYVRGVRAACQQLHAEPFSTQARADLLDLLVQDAPSADAALRRIGAANLTAAAKRCVVAGGPRRSPGAGQ
jgi:hypothetical protein